MKTGGPVSWLIDRYTWSATIVAYLCCVGAGCVIFWYTQPPPENVSRAEVLILWCICVTFLFSIFAMGARAIGLHDIRALNAILTKDKGIGGDTCSNPLRLAPKADAASRRSKTIWLQVICTAAALGQAFLAADIAGKPVAGSNALLVAASAVCALLIIIPGIWILVSQCRDLAAENIQLRAELEMAHRLGAVDEPSADR